MTGDFAVDVPIYDAVFAGLSKQWPPLAEDLKVCEWVSIKARGPRLDGCFPTTWH
jgi:hypothetical protein